MALRLFFGVGFLALSFVLFLGTPPSNAQSDCIGGCIGAYVDCTNSSGGTPNCDEQYDKCVDDCIDRQFLFSSSELEPALQSGSAIGATPPASIEDMLGAHGGRPGIQAIDSYRIELTKFVNTVPPRFFAQRVRLTVEGDKIRREISSPQGDQTRLEMIDGRGQFHAVDMDWAEGAGARSGNPRDARRHLAVRTNVCGLIPFLKVLCDPAASETYLGLEQGNMKYLIAAPGKRFTAYLDENRRISRVEVGRNTFEFTDFRRVASLLLPFVERIYVGDYQVFEFLLSSCEINPTFQSNTFNAAAER